MRECRECLCSVGIDNCKKSVAGRFWKKVPDFTWTIEGCGPQESPVLTGTLRGSAVVVRLGTWPIEIESTAFRGTCKCSCDVERGPLQCGCLREPVQMARRQAQESRQAAKCERCGAETSGEAMCSACFGATGVAS